MMRFVIVLWALTLIPMVLCANITVLSKPPSGYTRTKFNSKVLCNKKCRRELRQQLGHANEIIPFYLTEVDLCNAPYYQYPVCQACNKAIVLFNVSVRTYNFFVSTVYGGPRVHNLLSKIYGALNAASIFLHANC